MKLQDTLQLSQNGEYVVDEIHPASYAAKEQVCDGLPGSEDPMQTTIFTLGIGMPYHSYYNRYRNLLIAIICDN